jgi:hypothetical protein
VGGQDTLRWLAMCAGWQSRATEPLPR